MEDITNIENQYNLDKQREIKGTKDATSSLNFMEFIKASGIEMREKAPSYEPISPEDLDVIINQDKEIEFEKEQTGQGDLDDPEYIKSITSKTVNVNPHNLEIVINDSNDSDPIKLSTEELNRRQDEANAQYAPVQVHHGDVVQVGSMPDTDYIVMTFSDGTFSQPLHRRTAIERAGAVLEMIEAETGSATGSVVDKDVWLCLETLRAAIKNGRSRGLEYNTTAIKNFEKRILKAERSWRDRSDYKPGPDAPRKVYMGNN